MFITQTPSKVDNFSVDLDKSDDDLLFLGVEKTDFRSPCVSTVKALWDPQYSDISDTDDFKRFW